jgi:hypothetical protein
VDRQFLAVAVAVAVVPGVVCLMLLLQTLFLIK